MGTQEDKLQLRVIEPARPKRPERLVAISNVDASAFMSTETTFSWIKLHAPSTTNNTASAAATAAAATTTTDGTGADANDLGDDFDEHDDEDDEGGGDADES